MRASLRGVGDMATVKRRKHGYIEGNTVRKIQPLERPAGRQEQRPHPGRKKSQKERIQYVNIFYTVFLVAAAVMVLWSCVNYLQLQAETTSRVKHIAELETELENKRKENDDNYTRIMTSVNLDYVREVAINELGMVYASEDQVILYDGGTRDYVRQNAEIPDEEVPLIDRILGR